MPIPHETAPHTQETEASAHQLDMEQINAPNFNPSDLHWLPKVSGKAESDFDLEALNRLNDIAALDLRYAENEPLSEQVVQARQDFFAKELGWGNDNHPYHPTYVAYTNEPWIPQPLRFASRARAVTELRYDVKVLREPSVGMSSVDELASSAAYLRETDISDESVERFPRLLTTPASVLDERRQELQNGGLTEKGITQYPLILLNRPEVILGRLDHAIELGFNADKLSKNPSLLTQSSETLDTKLTQLEEAGVSLNLVIKNPFLLNHSMESIHTKIEAYRKMGLEDDVFLSKSAILANSVDTIQGKITTFADMGIGLEEINKAPKVLTADPETLRRTMRLVDRLLKLGNLGITALDYVKASPQAATTTSARKILAVARVLAEHGNPEAMADDIRKSMTTPVDTFISVAANNETVNTSALNKERKVTPSSERRSKALESIASGRLSKEVIRAYLRYQPLKSSEVERYPELEEHRDIGSTQ